MPLNQSCEAEKETDKLVGITMPLPNKLLYLSPPNVRGFFIIIGGCENEPKSSSTR